MDNIDFFFVIRAWGPLGKEMYVGPLRICLPYLPLVTPLADFLDSYNF